MTYQIRDSLLLNNAEWHLEECIGKGWFTPEDFGIDVAGASSTACYRGYCCAFNVIDNVLSLTKLQIHLDESNLLPLNGVLPVKAKHFFDANFPNSYQNIQLPILFTGGFIIGQNGFKELPSSIGPELAWQYENVRELIFDQGKLIEEHDCSNAIERIRQEIAATGGKVPLENPSGNTRSDVYRQYDALKARINSCFKLDYYHLR